MSKESIDLDSLIKLATWLLMMTSHTKGKRMKVKELIKQLSKIKNKDRQLQILVGIEDVENETILIPINEESFIMANF